MSQSTMTGPGLSTIITGDCIDGMRTLPAGVVQTCVTSPPYWGLRDYGCAGQIGLEPTPDEYVARMRDVMREVWRVLRDDGTLWLNLGDSYAGSWGNQGRTEERGTQRPINGPMMQNLAPYPVKQSNTGAIPKGSGLKPKDLVGIPWRVAFALQADGWYLRSDVIWAKPNPMPESVKDRPTKAHEYVFLLSKNERYFYDAAAVAEKCADSTIADARIGTERVADFEGAADAFGEGTSASRRLARNAVGNKHSRNRRTVWTITPKPFTGAHFATMPPDLARVCILAGSPPGGLVLDPFAGSGTTGVVACEHGRSFVGCELNPAYVSMAENRIAKAREQLRLLGAV
jgi:DNA modification methylase